MPNFKNPFAGSAFACPQCGHDMSAVKDSRPSNELGGTRRRRLCLNENCKHRFTTIEIRVETFLGMRGVSPAALEALAVQASELGRTLRDKAAIARAMPSRTDEG